eukprot:6181796-Pleurochrysis_carterae.AAC.3
MSHRPCVHRNTPPNPTSSPNTTAAGFVRSAIRSASVIAATMVICVVSRASVVCGDTTSTRKRRARERSTQKEDTVPSSPPQIKRFTNKTTSQADTELCG